MVEEAGSRIHRVAEEFRARILSLHYSRNIINTADPKCIVIRNAGDALEIRRRDKVKESTGQDGEEVQICSRMSEERGMRDIRNGRCV